jgi:hypothetical protein
MSREFEKGVDSVSPHPRWHVISRGQSSEGRGGILMIRCEEAITVFVEKTLVQRNERPALVVAEGVFAVSC